MKPFYTLKERIDGSFTIVGVDHGYGSCTIVAETKEHLIAHIPGSSYASGQSRQYAAARLEVFTKMSAWRKLKGAAELPYWEVDVHDHSGFIGMEIGRGWLKTAKAARAWHRRIVVTPESQSQ